LPVTVSEYVFPCSAGFTPGNPPAHPETPKTTSEIMRTVKHHLPQGLLTPSQATMSITDKQAIAIAVNPFLPNVGRSPRKLACGALVRRNIELPEPDPGVIVMGLNAALVPGGSPDTLKPMALRNAPPTD